MTSTCQNSPAAHTTAPTTKRKAGLACVKCKKSETPHASKCGRCCSNDHKRRKVVHRKKQQQARHRLQASSRQAVQEGAIATGWLGGLGKKLKELHKATWEEDKVSRSIPNWLGPVTDLPPLLIEKGCEDNLTVLVSTEFAKR